jgi:sec-independent protein translocase protein TatC
MKGNSSPEKVSLLTHPPFASMTLVDHLWELRRRLIVTLVAFLVAFGSVYPFSEELFIFLVKPLAHIVSSHSHRLIYTGLTEAFLTYIKVSLLGAFVLVTPVFLSQIWFFIVPGLYRQERKIFIIFLLTAPLLFLAGASLAYGVVCPLAWKFFLSFETPSVAGSLPIHLEARVSEYLSLVTKLILSFGLSFQLPIVLLLLGRAGFLKGEKLKAQRKYAFLAIVVVAALVTPPDFLSPLSLIVPIYGLYELSVALMCFQEKKGSPSRGPFPSES